MADVSDDRPWTLLELLNWTTGYFQQAGIEDARLNAEMLLAKVTSLERIMLYANFDREIAPREREQYRDLVKRRAQRCPLQYLLGSCEFYGRDLEVTPAVMVPRQETELVVEKCLEKLPGDGPDSWAADVGTGSGIIAVTLACERQALHVVATDNSAEAIEVARRNSERHGVSDRIRFGIADLCDALPAGLVPGDGGLGLLVANPPYIPSARIEQLQPEVRDYEPREALDGGPDGLAVIRKLIPQAGIALNPDGWLVLELGEDQSGQVADMIAATPSFDADSIETTRDAGGCERVLAVRKGREYTHPGD